MLYTGWPLLLTIPHSFAIALIGKRWYLKSSCNPFLITVNSSLNVNSRSKERMNGKILVNKPTVFLNAFVCLFNRGNPNINSSRPNTKPKYAYNKPNRKWNAVTPCAALTEISSLYNSLLIRMYFRPLSMDNAWPFEPGYLFITRSILLIGFLFQYSLCISYSCEPRYLESSEI